MKCPHCGAPLRMEDKFCSYCGAPNTLAMKHQADMEHYEREFTETQEEVLNKSRKAGSLTGFLVVLIIMIVVNIVALAISANAWDIRYKQRNARVSKHADEYRAVVEQMIADQHYIGLREYYYNNRLSGAEVLPEYEAVLRYAGKLDDMYMYLCDTDSYRYRLSESGLQNTVTYLSEDIIELYEDPKDSYFQDVAITDDKLVIIEDIRNQAEALLVTYAGLTKEEISELQNMSKARIQDVLTEHLTQVMAEKEAADEAKAAAETESISEEEFLNRLIGGEYAEDILGLELPDLSDTGGDNA